MSTRKSLSGLGVILRRWGLQRNAPGQQSRATAAPTLDCAQLEDRVLFNAAPLAAKLLGLETGLDPAADPSANHLADDAWPDLSGSEPAELNENLFPLHTDDVQAAWQHLPAAQLNLARDPSAPRELVIVDTGVSDYQPLVDDILAASDGRQLQVALLNANQDGIGQINEILSNYDDLAAVHLVSHGTEGNVKLGSTWLGLDNLTGYASDIAAWQHALTSTADLLFYGCDLAGNADGQALVEAISALTGADVAASSDLTGNAQLGGDWDLEYTAGSIDSSVAFGNDVQADWWSLLGPGGWQYRQQLTFDNSAQTETLSDFPVLVHLDNTNFDFTKAETNGEDIRFYDDDDMTPLKYEIESWDAVAEEADIWVKVPQIDGASSTDFIWMYYGKPGATDAQDSANVWDVNYAGVWHLDEDVTDGETTGTHVDSTANANDGTQIQNEDVAGQISKGQLLDGSNDYIDVGNGSSVDITGTQITVEAWINANAWESQWWEGTVVDKHQWESGIRDGYVLRAGQDGGPNGEVGFMFGDGSGWHEALSTNINMPTDKWHYLVGTYDGSNVEIFVDGKLEDSTATTAAMTSSASDLNFGRNAYSDSRFLDGLIDEVRVSDTARSGDWIAAQYASMAGTLVTFGAEQPAPLAADALWLSTAGDVGSSPLTGLASWTAGEVIQMGDPDFDLEPGITNGTFSSAFNLDNFAADLDADVTGLHYVTQDVTVGAAAIQLEVGDLLLSTLDTELLPGAVTVNPQDVFLFEPTGGTNYTSGTFTLLLADPLGGLANITGLSLVERTVDVGNATLDPGTFLLSREGGGDESIFLFDPISGTDSELIDGVGLGIAGPGQRPTGLALVQQDTVLGQTSLQAGWVLVTLEKGETVGGNAVTTWPEDIFYLDIGTTGPGTTTGNAGLLLGGGDLGLAAAAKYPDGIAIVNTTPALNTPPTAANDAYNTSEDTPLNVVVPASWYNAAWSARQKLTFDNLAQTENLTDFPVLVQLDATRIDYAKTQNAGEDLRFVDAGGAVLDHQIELWDEAGTSYVWVKVPEILASSNTDHIWVYYDNPIVSDGQNAAGVWSSSYQGVYHLNEDPGAGGVLADSTLNTFDATNQNTSDAGGVIANGQAFAAATSQYIDLGDDRAFLNNVSSATLSAWVHPDTLSGQQDIVSISRNSGGASATVSRASLRLDGNEIAVLADSEDDTSVTTSTTTSSPLVAGQWQFVTAVIDYANDSIRVFVDDVEQTMGGSVSFVNTATPNTNSTNSTIGSQDDGSGNFFDGRIDEVRVAATDRSADWIAAQYLSTTDTFVSFGSVEVIPGLLANDGDPESDPLSVTNVDTTGTTGMVSVNGDGGFSYDPNGQFEILAVGETGTDSFTYTISDGNGATDTATVTITINGVNDGPTATADGFATDEDTSFTTASALANDSDPDSSDVLSVAGINTAGTTGLVTNNGDGTFSYDPNGQFDSLNVGDTATDTFTYTISDGNGGTDTATVSITVTGNNDAPELSNIEPVALAYAEGDGKQALTSSITLTDVDSGVSTVIISINSGYVVGQDFLRFTNQPTVTGSWDGLLGTLTLSGPATAADFEAALRTIEYENTAPNVTPGTRSVSIVAFDTTGETDLTSRDIEVTAVNDPPTVNLNNVITMLSENYDTSLGVKMADIEITDDALGVNDLALAGGDAALFEIVADELWLVANATLDHETNPVLDVTVEVDDTDVGATPDDTASLATTVFDVNEPPAATDDGGAAFAADATTSHTTGDVLANDSDPDAGDTLTVVGFNPTGTLGTVAYNGDGTFNYDPNGQFDGLSSSQTATDTFTYTISDGNGRTDTATVTITVTGSDDPPTANDDSGAPFTTDEDTSFTTGNALANDTDPDTSDTLSVTGINTAGTTGLVTDNGDGTFSYDPNGQFESLAIGETATDTFTYTISDAGGGTDTATVTITVTGVNDGPTATADGFGTDEDTSFTTGNALANDTDPDTSDTLSVTGIITAGTTGLVTDNGDGTFSYDPNGQFESLAVGETATDSFTYTISDGNGGIDTATVTITINGRNDGPTATADGFATDEDTSFTTGNALTNDTDPDTSDTLSVTGINTAGTTGLVTDNGDGTFTYDPNGQFESLAVGETATDTFTYTISDGNGGTDTATVTITITGVNDGPTATDDGFGADEDASFTTGNVLANDTDPDTSDTLSVTGINTAGATGLVTNNGDGTFTYDPNGQFENLAVSETATDSFTYTISDGNGGTDTATVTIMITGVNDGPTATDDGFGTDEDTSFTTGNVLANDTDPDTSDSLSVTGINTAGTTGLVTDNGDGTFTYDPNGQFESLAAGETASDSFTYAISDGNGGTDTATVTITVNGVNDAPVVANIESGALAYTEGDGEQAVTSSITLSDVDSDIFTASVTISSGYVSGQDFLRFVDEPNVSGSWDGLLGTLTLFGPATTADFETALRSVAYENTATNVVSSTRGISILVRDTTTLIDTTSRDIEVTAVNDPPTADDESLTISEGGTATEADLDAGTSLLDGDSDPDLPSDTLTIDLTPVSGPSHGMLTLGNDGTFSYTHDDSENFTDSFTYRMRDAAGITDTATVSITITPVNDNPPVADNESFTVDEGGTATEADLDAGTNLLDGDTDFDLPFDLLDVDTTPDVGPTHGSLTLNSDGTFVYTHDGSENFTDSFTYHVHDAAGHSDTATVTITITPVNDNPPVADDESFTVDEGGTATEADLDAGTSLLDGDTVFDLPFDVLDVDTTPDVAPAHGSLTLNSDGTFVYTHDGSENFTDSFTYHVHDAAGHSDTATVTITITPVNDNPPVADDESFTVDEGGTATEADLDVGTNLLDGDTDLDLPLDALDIDITPDFAPAHGSLALNSDGTFVYTHDGSENYTDSFSYHVHDAAGNTGTATVSITITPVNDNPPVADDESFTVAEGGTATQADLDNGTSLLDGDTDFDLPFDVLDVDTMPDVGPTHGSLTLNADGTFVYTHDGSENFTDSFTYHVHDAAGHSDTATVTITITPVNDNPPVADDESFTVDEGGTATEADLDAGTNLLDGDTDFDLPFDAIDVDVTPDIGPVHGSLILNSDGTFVYTHNGSENFTDSFTYHVHDAAGNTDTATVTITITPVNDNSPVADDESFTVLEGDTATEADLDVGISLLDGDTDVDLPNDMLTVDTTAISNPLHGVLTLNADGTFSYTHDGSENFTDSFTYGVRDAVGNKDTGTVVITVIGTNDPPTAVDDSGTAFTTDEDITFTTGNVLSNDSDPDAGDSLSVLDIDTSGTLGSVTNNGDGTFTYTPAPDFAGTDTFTYRATDGTTHSNTAVVTLRVKPVNDPPKGAADAYEVDNNETLDVPNPGVLTNDVDVEGDPLTVALISGPEEGTLSLDSDGSFQYQPDVAFSGTDQFTYKASDGQATSKPVTVTIKVIAVAAPPPPDSGDEGPVIVIDPTDEDDDSPIGDSATPLPELDPSDDEGTGPRLTPPRHTDEPTDPFGAAPDLSDAADGSLQEDLLAFSDLYSRPALTVIRRALQPGGIGDIHLPGDAAIHLGEAWEYFRQLDSLEDMISSEADLNHVAAGAVGVVSLGLSAGYAFITIRAGYLLSSLLASMPAWRAVDPLPVLAYLDNDDEDDSDESLESMVAKAELVT